MNPGSAASLGVRPGAHDFSLVLPCVNGLKTVIPMSGYCEERTFALILGEQSVACAECSAHSVWAIGSGCEHFAAHGGCSDGAHGAPRVSWGSWGG